LKDYIRRYRPFLAFLGKFFLTYLILTGIYQLYLHQFDESKLEVDGITRSVAIQAQDLLLLFNANASTEKHELQPCIKLFFEGRYVARIIEGCNAISVMILFIAFIVAFAGKWKHTILFIIGGCVLIHILNITRIALLSAAIFHYPEQEHILHGVVFPLFIYSVVFILWVVWVNKFSSYATTG
jgi:exosortase family protein XrtF